MTKRTVCGTVAALLLFQFIGYLELRSGTGGKFKAGFDASISGKIALKNMSNHTLSVGTINTSGKPGSIDDKQKSVGTILSERRKNVTVDFPSLRNRIELYLGQWRSSCQPQQALFQVSAPHEFSFQVKNQRGEKFHLNRTLSLNGTFALDLGALRDHEALSPPIFKQVAVVWADAILPVVDLQDFKYNPLAIPIVVQTTTPTDPSISIPRLSETRILNSENDVCESKDCIIIWDTIGTRFRAQLKDLKDTDWVRKHDKVVLRLPMNQQSMDMMDSINRSNTLDIKIASPRKTKKDPGTADDSSPTFQLRHKAVMVFDDPISLAWALWSTSVVFLPPIQQTSWLMEDHLQPWLHYIPIDRDLSNVETRLAWVLEHPGEAREIAVRATEWMQQLYLDEEAPKSNTMISAQVIRRYKEMYGFDPKLDTSNLQVPRTEFIPKVFQAGGRSEAELVARARQVHKESTTLSQMKTAVCYKSIFGAADLHRFVKWTTYNYLLGFDMSFIWFNPSVRQYEGFELLDSLPYVTLLESRNSVVREVYKDYERNVNPEDGQNVQLDLERKCLGETAKEFDWVMFADSDEYLWFHEKEGIKEFITRHGGDNTYMSFGKYMYDRSRGVDIPDSGFGLDMYPFTTGSFCANGGVDKELQQPGSNVCPLNAGRSKVIVQPQHWDHVQIHGTHIPNVSRKSIHFPTDMAHFKEWNGIFHPVETRVVDPVNFTVDKLANLTTHRPGIVPNDQGTFTVQFDSELHDWMEFVVHRRNVSASTTIESEGRTSDGAADGAV